MILTQLQEAIVARLLWDAYFTEPGKEITVLAEGGLSLLERYAQAIGKLGVCVVVTTPSYLPTERVKTDMIHIVIDFSEHIELNRGRNGSQKVAADVASKALALLRDWNPGEIWRDLDLGEGGMSRIGEDEQGLDHWALHLMTQTVYELVVQVIGTENNVAIGDQAGTPFIVSPTPA